jgi:trk system potassium uptake protein TrkA
VLVLQGDSTDEDLLGDENVQEMDLFLALTSDDEDNIMACLLAKRMGARRVLAVINRRAYADLVQGTQIDIAISPSARGHRRAAGLCAARRRGGRAQPAPRRRRGAGRHRARRRQDLPHGRPAHRRDRLPAGAQIGALVRGLHLADGSEAEHEFAKPRVIIAHHDTVVLQHDHVIIFVPRKRMVHEVEKLFQVSATFMF